METTNLSTPVPAISKNLESFAKKDNTYVAFMKIVSSQTKQFKESKAKCGEWWAAETSMGTKVNVVFISYRYSIAAQDKGNSTVANLFEMEGETEIYERETYLQFREKYKTLKIVDGVDALLYLVDSGLFVILHLKGATRDTIVKIVSNGVDNQILTLVTKHVAPPKLSYDWYEIDVVPTGKFLSEKLDSQGQLAKFKLIEEVVEKDDQER